MKPVKVKRRRGDRKQSEREAGRFVDIEETCSFTCSGSSLDVSTENTRHQNPHVLPAMQPGFVLFIPSRLDAIFAYPKTS